MGKYKRCICEQSKQILGTIVPIVFGSSLEDPKTFAVFGSSLEDPKTLVVFGSSLEDGKHTIVCLGKTSACAGSTRSGYGW